VFSSCVRGEEGKNSDIDIFVEFKEPVGLFEFMDLEEYLENLLGGKVDLVSKKALKQELDNIFYKRVFIHEQTHYFAFTSTLIFPLKGEETR